MPLFATLSDLSQSALALSGAILGDPAGQIHPQLKQGIEEITRLAGIALDEAKGMPGINAPSTPVAVAPVGAQPAPVTSCMNFPGFIVGFSVRSKLHESNFI